MGSLGSRKWGIGIPAPGKGQKKKKKKKSKKPGSSGPQTATLRSDVVPQTELGVHVMGVPQNREHGRAFVFKPSSKERKEVP